MTAIDRHLHSTGELRALSFAELHQLFADGIVKHGPFAGLKYPELNSIGSALYPKLLGCYEAEIQDWIETSCNTDYSEIVDVGCAEGFYAVGLARRILDARVFAYDTDPEARRMTTLMAAANGVADRVTARGTFAATDITSIPVRRKGLLVCDCEGHEKNLFTAETLPLFADWNILIETHDLFDITISTNLERLFATTHSLRTAISKDDIQKVKTYRYPELDGLDLPTRRAIVSEYRPSLMEWFFLTPLSQPAS